MLLPVAHSLQLHIEELRTELTNCLDHAERRQIKSELEAAQAALAAQRTD